MARGIERTEEEALNYIRPILPLLQRGMSEVQSCDYARISVDTLNHYKVKFESVYIEIRTAKMHLIATASDTISKNINDPKIALEVLKRRSKETWGDSIDYTTGGAPINNTSDRMKEIATKLDNLLDLDETPETSAGDS